MRRCLKSVIKGEKQILSLSKVLLSTSQIIADQLHISIDSYMKEEALLFIFVESSN